MASRSACEANLHVGSLHGKKQTAPYRICMEFGAAKLMSFFNDDVEGDDPSAGVDGQCCKGVSHEAGLANFDEGCRRRALSSRSGIVKILAG